jgi:hypothetical protein
MHSREQYLDRVREEYRKADKKAKTRLNRNVLIAKLAHPVVVPAVKKRRPRKWYTPEVLMALIKVWEVFDSPGGQRLAPALRQKWSACARARIWYAAFCVPVVAARPVW